MTAKTAIGAGALATAGAGAAGAYDNCVEVDADDGDAYVYYRCGRSVSDIVDNGVQGTATDHCLDYYGNELLYVEWDDAYSNWFEDGWVSETELSSC